MHRQVCERGKDELSQVLSSKSLRSKRVFVPFSNHDRTFRAELVADHRYYSLRARCENADYAVNPFTCSASLVRLNNEVSRGPRGPNQAASTDLR